MSRLTTKISLFFGTLGALIILLQGIKPITDFLSFHSSDMTVIGSACFTVAAAALVWNKAFCVSGNHARYVVAQFDLGKEITQFELDWQRWLNENSTTVPLDRIATDVAFKLFKDFSDSIYKIIRDDTKKWEKSLPDRIDAVERMLQKTQHHNP